MFRYCNLIINLEILEDEIEAKLIILHNKSTIVIFKYMVNIINTL